MWKQDPFVDQGDYLLPEQLYIGAYVILELPWYAHSFAFNNFLIQTNDQIYALRNLKLKKYKYDRNRSTQPILSTDKSSIQELDDVYKVEALPTVDHSDQYRQGKRVDKSTEALNPQLQTNLRFNKALQVLKVLNSSILDDPHKTVAQLGLLIDEMVNAFLHSSDTTLCVMTDISGRNDFYVHSLNVAIMAAMLAKDMGFNVNESYDMCLSALLHDIGLHELPRRIIQKAPNESTKSERKLRESHLEYGYELGKKAGLSKEALLIMEQHHEFADGSGFPNGLNAQSMSLGSRIVSLVNYFDNLCNPADSKPGMTPHEALAYMYSKCNRKFDALSLQVLIRTLGVHPPGTIVQLSNDKFAVVTAVNPRRPMKPCVVVYNENIPREFASVLDLEQSSIKIKKAISPLNLSPKISAYLVPGRKLVYFFANNPLPSLASQNER